jgi:hypothetical protein
MDGKRRRRAGLAIVLVAVAVMLGRTMPALAAERPPPPRDVLVDDGGTCYSADYDCGTPSLETGVSSESFSAYGFDSYDAAAGRCRTRWAKYKFVNLTHTFTLWTYYQQVRWCWRGGIVTAFRRDRWSGGTSLGWTFDGHVYTNCGPTDVEHCTGKVGAYSENAMTEGHYHVCLGVIGINICRNKYPWLSITVHGDGGSLANAWL